MNQKAVSPLIITVILVGFVFVISLVVFSFGIDIHKSTMEDQEINLEKLGLINFDAYFKDDTCEAGGNEFCYRLLISSSEDIPLEFVVRTVSDFGADIDRFEFEPYQQKVVTITYPKSMKEDVYAEITPVEVSEEN
jgi:hypothetical protein